MASERPLPAWLRSPKLHVRVPSRPGVVLVVATSRVSHVPAGADGAGLTLCQHYDGASSAAMARAAAAGASLCPDGAACGFVHADVRGATEYTPHVRAEAAAYARFAPGNTIVLARPNEPSATECIASHELLQTRVLQSGRYPLSHCAHFLTKGRCDRGPACNFAHFVPIVRRDEEAAALTRNDSDELSLVQLCQAAPSRRPSLRPFLRTATPVGPADDSSSDGVCSVCAAAADAPVDPTHLAVPGTLTHRRRHGGGWCNSPYDARPVWRPCKHHHPHHQHSSHGCE